MLSDRVVAAVDYTNDTVTALSGVDGDDHGIVKGHASGKLSFTPNAVDGGMSPSGMIAEGHRQTA